MHLEYLKLHPIIKIIQTSNDHMCHDYAKVRFHTTLFNQSLVSDLAFSFGSYHKMINKIWLDRRKTNLDCESRKLNIRLHNWKAFIAMKHAQPSLDPIKKFKTYTNDNQIKSF